MTGASALQSLTERVFQDLSVDGVLVTEVTSSCEIVLASAGLRLPDDLRSHMPLRYSICQHVVEMDYPLVVENAYIHPLLSRTDAVMELGIAAYLGVPTHTASGVPFGAICAIKRNPYRWCQNAIDVVMRGAREIDQMMVSPLALSLQA